MKQSVIIVAGGKGLRMGSDLPKQFLPVGGKPVLMHTLEAFRKYDAMLQIILYFPVNSRTSGNSFAKNIIFRWNILWQMAARPVFIR